jgi:hypothetical protein
MEVSFTWVALLCGQGGASNSNYGLIGTYTDPHILIAYSYGEVRQESTLVYAAEIESGELKLTLNPKKRPGCRSRRQSGYH